MLANLTAQELVQIINKFEEAVRFIDTPQVTVRKAREIFAITAHAQKEERLENMELVMIFQLFLNHPFLQQSVQKNLILTVINETYEYRPYSVDAISLMHMTKV